MKYLESVNYLFSQLPMFQKQGSTALKKDLSNIKSLLKWLNNPHKRFTSIHVAGTNGKGSVCHYLASWLHMHGFKVGLYTSPHYKDFRERIKIDGELLDKRFVTNFVKDYQTNYVSDNIRIPSFFELTVAMAFKAFEQYDVNVAIVETGLGGRLDSTNVITPALSVITNISFDHQQFLGNTLKAIAKEKAGIIKKDVPVIIGEKQEEIESVFIAKANSKNASLCYAQDICSINSKTLKVKGKKQMPHGMKLSRFQKQNFSTALASLIEFRKVSKTNFNIDYKRLLANTDHKMKEWKYMGRMQVLQKSPVILVDSCHNLAGLSYFFSELKNIKFNKLHIVTGFVNDKKLEDISPLFPIDAKYYFVQADIPRAKNKEALKDFFLSKGFKGKSYSSVRQGLKAAKLSAGKKDLVCVIGSIFVVAEVL